MRLLGTGTTVGCALPVLEVFTLVDGFMQDVEVLEFTIVDSAGTQVNPSQPARDTLDPTIDCPAGPRKGVGHYVAPFTVPNVLGVYTINWFWKRTTLADEISTSVKFEVVNATDLSEPLAYYYVGLSAMRAEGVPAAVTDARLIDAIAMASRQAEMWTTRFFSPRAATYHLKGTGNRRVFIDQPIIAIEETSIEATPGDEDGLVIDPTYYRVFNRHLSEGLLSPDDRLNPKLEMLHGRDIYGRSVFDDFAGVSLGALIFPSGPQTVKVSGVFGYTDPDGSLYGRTPRMLQHAIGLLLQRYLPKLADSDTRTDLLNTWRLVEEKTREQSYKLSEAKGGRGGATSHTVSGYLTGDPEIDNILIMYMRPPAMGAA